MQSLPGFARPNLYFHVTPARNILRYNGVDRGKRDCPGDPYRVMSDVTPAARDTRPCVITRWRRIAP
jgi:Domain of unknown function (DUF1993)